MNHAEQGMTVQYKNKAGEVWPAIVTVGGTRPSLFIVMESGATNAINVPHGYDNECWTFYPRDVPIPPDSCKGL
jgi:hypothetical protein